MAELVRANQRQPAPERESPPDSWREKNSFLFGGLAIPRRFTEFDTIISGGKGTGKTTALIALMLSLIRSQMASGRPFNVHAYTPKPDDFYPLLKAVFEPLGISVRNTNPFVRDSWCWDGSIDLRSPPKIDELVSTLMRDDPQETNRFFKKAAQLDLRGHIQSLATTHPGLWTWRHLAHSMKRMESTIAVLSRCEETRHILGLLSDAQGQTAANVFAEVLTELKGLDLVASLLDATPDDRRFSIRDAANQPGVIWVWGSDPRYETTVEPWNGVQLELLGHELLIRGDIGIDTLLFVDEMAQLNGGQKLPIIKRVVEYARSSCLRSVFAIQTPGQVISTFGEAEADVILGQTHNVMAFRHSDIKGCEYWAKRIGRMRGKEKKKGHSIQTGGSSTRGGGQWSETTSWSETFSVNEERYDLERVTPSDIGDLPVGSYELGMFGIAMLPLSLRRNPTNGFPEPIKWWFHMTPEWIREHVPNIRHLASYRRSLKPESSYTLKPLEDWEWDFLDLERPTTPAPTKRPPWRKGQQR